MRDHKPLSRREKREAALSQKRAEAKSARVTRAAYAIRHAFAARRARSEGAAGAGAEGRNGKVLPDIWPGDPDKGSQ